MKHGKTKRQEIQKTVYETIATMIRSNRGKIKIPKGKVQKADKKLEDRMTKFSKI